MTTSAAHSKLRYPKGTFDAYSPMSPALAMALRKTAKFGTAGPVQRGPAPSLQTQIAMRGLALLKVGGLMVYSTCSFNPVENEAVVASLLRRCRGAVELVDTSSMLPKLVRRPGMHTWKVAVEHPQSELDKDAGTAAETVKIGSPDDKVKMGIKFVDSMEDIPDHIEGTGFDFKKHAPDMFPPSAEDAAKMHLEYCWRMMPHDQNTGGFFLALLRKTGELQGPEGPRKTKATETVQKEEASRDDDDVTMSDSYASAADDASGSSVAAADKEPEEPADVSGVPRGMVSAGNKTGSDVRGRAKSYLPPVLRAGGHDMYNKWVVGEENEKIWAKVKDHFGIMDSFNEAQLYTRSSNAKIISYVNKAMAETCMDFANNERKLKIVNAGLRMFEKAREKASQRVATKSGVVGKACPYRLNHESLHLIEPYMTKRKVTCSMEDMEKGECSPEEATLTPLPARLSSR